MVLLYTLHIMTWKLPRIRTSHACCLRLTWAKSGPAHAWERAVFSQRYHHIEFISRLCACASYNDSTSLFIVYEKLNWKQATGNLQLSRSVVAQNTSFSFDSISRNSKKMFIRFKLNEQTRSTNWEIPTICCLLYFEWILWKIMSNLIWNINYFLWYNKAQQSYVELYGKNTWLSDLSGLQRNTVKFRLY